MEFRMQIMKTLGIVSAVALGLTACAGTQKEPAQAEAPAPAAEAPAEEAAAEAPAEEAPAEEAPAEAASESDGGSEN